MEEKYRLNNIVADLDNVLQRNSFFRNGQQRDQLNCTNTKIQQARKILWSKINLKHFNISHAIHVILLMSINIPLTNTQQYTYINSRGNTINQ